MKLSQFNLQLFWKGNFLIYNSLSNQYFIINEDLNNIFTALLHERNVETLSNYHPTFFRELVQSKFIIDDSVDEIEEVKILRRKADFNEEQYELIINPTMNCNFKCWYCYETHIKDSKMSEQTLEKVIRHISYVIKSRPKIKKLHIQFFGGEPLLYYNKIIVPILDYVHKQSLACPIKFTSAMTTNGFLLDIGMIDNFKKFKFQSFQVTLDGYKELHDKVRFVSSKRGSYDKIIENIVMMCNAGLQIILRINYSEDSLDKLESIIPDLRRIREENREFVQIHFHKVWQVELNEELENKVYTLIKTFIHNGFKARKGVALDNVRNPCYADKLNQATINYNGEVFKCTARDFKSENREGFLDDNGIINWNEKLEKRMDIKFKNKPCLSCPILPICNGGCSQHALDNIGVDYCVHDFDINNKKKWVLENFLALNPSFR